MLALRFFSSCKVLFEGLKAASEYVKLIRNVLDLEKNALILRNSGSMDALFYGLRENHKLMPTNIDVWIVGNVLN